MKRTLISLAIASSLLITATSFAAPSLPAKKTVKPNTKTAKKPQTAKLKKLTPAAKPAKPTPTPAVTPVEATQPTNPAQDAHMMKGWYIGANVGRTRVLRPNIPATYKVTRQAFGASFNLGYMITPYVGVETGYTYYNTFNYHQNSLEQGYIKLNGLDVAVKGVLPLPRGFNIFGKVGLSSLYVNIHNKHDATAPIPAITTGVSQAYGLYYALGAGYLAADNTEVNIQWNQARGNNKTGNADLLSLGVTYHIN